MDFQGGVNLSAGLPILRTSVDHGTAFDIAGKGIASDVKGLQDKYAKKPAAQTATTAAATNPMTARKKTYARPDYSSQAAILAAKRRQWGLS